MKKTLAIALAVFLSCAGYAVADSSSSEVLKETSTEVMVREHPKTGKPYAVIVSAQAPEAGFPYRGPITKASRPDYRMLDPKVKRGEIPYDGPYSDRRKVYYFAAGMATAGVLAGTLAPIAPAAAGAGGGGGGLGYGIAGTAVADGTISAALARQRPDPNRDDFNLKSEAILLEIYDSSDDASS